MRSFKDLTGHIIGSFTVLERCGSKKDGKTLRPLWKCKCSCGYTCFKTSKSLKQNKGKRTCNKCFPKNTHIDAAIKRLMSSYKSDAKKRSLEFNLTYEEFEKLTSENCIYCGQTPKLISKSYNGTENYAYNGIDRVDNSIGYKISNCATACFVCNRAKGNMSLEDFLD